uniref:BTB domain-containing protein n=1 Tax=Panagrolaimus sp. PS1159 TaxID=55785 RepID=A0AC35FGD0_9BILA
MDYEDHNHDYRSLQNLPGKTLVLQKNVYQLQLQRYEIFKEQNPETGNFDLTLEFVDGKKIYVHKFLIISVSETLNAMLSDRWSNNDDRTVKIEAYSSDNFFQFLSFLYSGGCDLTDENIFQLTDMAEFYGIQTLRDFCDSYLSKMKCTLENFFDMLEFQERYSLNDFNKSLECFFGRNLKELIKVQKFLTLKKSVIKILSSFTRPSDSEEDFFKAVYKWAEGQALIKHAVCDEQDFNTDDTTKNELSEILPLIKFAHMKYESVKSLIVEKEFLFSLSVSIQALSLSIRMWKAHDITHEEEDFIKLVTDKEFLFSHTQLCKALSKSEKQTKLEEQKAFQKVYELAEMEAIKKQQLTTDEMIDLNDIIKAEMSQFLNNFHYSYNMSFGFLIEFIVPKAFLFPVKKLYCMLSTVAENKDQEILFNTGFKLAEAEAAKALSVNPNLNVNKYVKRRFDKSLYIKFSQIKLEFMIENIVEKRFLFSPSEMYNHLLKCQRSPEQEEIFFKS